jgi:hypothetical protein
MVAVMPLGPHGRLLVDDHGRRTDKVKVVGSPGTFITVRLFTTFVAPGDTLLITGEANLTNNTGRTLPGQDRIPGHDQYAVGVATSLWVYDANAPAEERPATWRRLGTNGENCTADGHHIQQGLTRQFVVPDDWDPAHQIGVVLRVDAHSTGWDDNPVRDYMIVEQHGCLLVQHWPKLVPADPDVAVLEEQVASLTGRVTALETPPPPEVSCGPVA